MGMRIILCTFYCFYSLSAYAMVHKNDESDILYPLKANLATPVISVAFSDDAHVAAGESKSVSLWDIEKGSKICDISVSRPLRRIVIPPDDTNLIGMLHDHEVRYVADLWDKRSGIKEKEIEVGKDILDDLFSHLFSFNGENEFLGSQDGYIACCRYPYDQQSLECFGDISIEGIREWSKMTFPFSCCTLAQYGLECRCSLLFFAACFLEIWKKKVADSAIRAIAVSKDTVPTLAVAADKTLSLWQIAYENISEKDCEKETEEELLVLNKTLFFSRLIKSVAFSLNEKYLAAGLETGELQIFQLQ